MQETSSSSRRHDGTSAPRTCSKTADAIPPLVIHGHSHQQTSGGRCPIGSPVDMWTHTSGSFWPGGSAISRTSSPSWSRSMCRSRPANTVPWTVALKLLGFPGGNGGVNRGIQTSRESRGGRSALPD